MLLLTSQTRGFFLKHKFFVHTCFFNTSRCCVHFVKKTNGLLFLDAGKFRKEFRRAFDHCCQPSANNQRGYQLSNLYPKNTEKDSGIGSRSHSRSSKRTLTEVRRLGTIERGFTDNHRARRQSERTIVSKIEV